MTSTTSAARKEERPALTPGQRARMIRKKKGLSTDAVAAATGIGNGALSEFERDLREVGINTVKRLCLFYGVTSRKLLGF